MDLPTQSKARLTLAIVAALLGLSGVCAPLAVAASPATDEYVLEFPGVSQTDSSSAGAEIGPRPVHAGPQAGIVGEGDPPSSPLESIFDTVGSAPAALIAGFVGLLLIGLFTGPLGSRINAREAR